MPVHPVQHNGRTYYVSDEAPDERVRWMNRAAASRIRELAAEGYYVSLLALRWLEDFEKRELRKRQDDLRTK